MWRKGVMGFGRWVVWGVQEERSGGFSVGGDRGEFARAGVVVGVVRRVAARYAAPLVILPDAFTCAVLARQRPYIGEWERVARAVPAGWYGELGERMGCGPLGYHDSVFRAGA
ncbi:hypothetical protein Acor_32260 [Acrocarpospora corrugata]|uniref:Uncharacterized protein n=1 Tax=Acrocarpospora corrugata TaxID=35763 RepID=A0A5M3VZI0_9ACTN|nr:hypothetical protein Acor_32260 [Acrocarpospora corrugata]